MSGEGEGVGGGERERRKERMKGEKQGKWVERWRLKRGRHILERLSDKCRDDK